MGKDSKYLPILTRENYKDWFRRAQVKVKSKGVYYVFEQSRTEYAWIPREGGAVGEGKSETTATPTASGIDNLTSQFERLGGTWNIEDKKEWDQADAKLLEIILEGLSEDDSVLGDE